MEDIDKIKSIYEIALPAVQPLLNIIVEPKLEKLKKWFKQQKIQKELIEKGFQSKLEEYLLRTFERCYYLNTIVFPNQQIRLNDIYFPTKLVNTKNNHVTASDKIGNNFFDENDRVLISDYAGMGKSTLSKFLCTHIIVNKLGIPIYIELRSLKETNSIISEILKQLNPIESTFSEELVIKLLLEGDFIFILDGFDEIPSSNREFVFQDLRSFISKVSENTFILTSRPEASLSSFGDFQNFYIRPLTHNNAFEVIRKYDVINQNKIADKLISDIKIRIDQLDDFLSNPFLISLLYKSYTYNKDIPTKRVTFYDEVYSALYKAHDLSKDGYKRDKSSKLDIQDFRVILRDLAFSTSKNREVEYEEQQLLKYIKDSKENCSGIEFKESDFLEDLLQNVPLFIKDGNKVKWAHKSIQDYFSAEFICFHNRKEDILLKIYNSQNEAFLNILALTQELDKKTFRKTVLLSILKDFINHYNSTYKNFEKSEIVNDRKKLSYGIKLVFLQTKNELGFDKLREIVTTKYPSLIEEKLYISVSLNDYFAKLSSYNFNRGLIDLLYPNIKDLFISMQILAHSNSFTSVCQELGVPELVDDSVDNNLNNDVNFEITTGWFSEAIKSRNRSMTKAITLDFDKCVSEMKRIEKEINKEEKLNILDGI